MSELEQSWYSISPAGTVAIGNLTPVGQNSGQVDCRWPPNGHQLAACLNLPTDCTLCGPFWYLSNPGTIYVILPLPVYELERSPQKKKKQKIPPEIFRMVWEDNRWQVQSQHRDASIEVVGGRYLISGITLKQLWRDGSRKEPDLQEFPWQKLTLSHNSREEFQVKDEGGFFAEKTTLMDPGWSILVKIIGNYDWQKRLPNPPWSCIGAGATPVSIKREDEEDLTVDWLEGKAESFQGTGAVLLTGALWYEEENFLSVPYPPQVPIAGYAAEVGIPWQSWKSVRDRHNPERKVQVLTPGEWLTPAGAVYLWEGEAPLETSAPLPDRYHRHCLGYGHLWLFEENTNNGN
ncbi:hypothetical protein JJD41_20790 [Oxynema sp. CENA135]|uniref:hypothetical protein n=1 Tax=Oxynema sp. CENA135 TaxID=984206 RepID=UPI00190C624F|nr:hypothetical protein [Oxynema sp. CENA135]MBK4732284.1 hypothetical protein [Oxynema sp. CENA135]